MEMLSLEGNAIVEFKRVNVSGFPFRAQSVEELDVVAVVESLD